MHQYRHMGKLLSEAAPDAPACNTQEGPTSSPTSCPFLTCGEPTQGHHPQPQEGEQTLSIIFRDVGSIQVQFAQQP